MKKRRESGSGCIYKRKKQDGTFTWWFKFHVDGRAIVRNSHTSDREEAKRLLALELGKKAQGVPMPSHALTFGEAVENLKAANTANGKSTSYTFDVYLLPFFGKSAKMAAISTPRIRQYIDERKTDGASNGTINRSLTALGRAFSLAMEDGILHARPHIPMLKEANPRSGFFTREELDRVLAARSLANTPYLRDAILFGYLTGWRKGEMLNLKWRNVDFVAREIRLDPGTTKNGEGRVFPFSDEPEISEMLERRRGLKPSNRGKARVIAFDKQEKADAYVFTKKNGDQLGSFRKRWNKACVQAKCPGRLFHDLRRTTVRDLVRSGVSESVAMQLTGHKTRSVFDRYDITSSKDLREAVRKRTQAAG